VKVGLTLLSVKADFPKKGISTHSPFGKIRILEDLKPIYTKKISNATMS
jgi:hypothetical protein